MFWPLPFRTSRRYRPGFEVTQMHLSPSSSMCSFEASLRLGFLFYKMGTAMLPASEGEGG